MKSWLRARFVKQLKASLSLTLVGLASAVLPCQAGVTFFSVTDRFGNQGTTWQTGPNAAAAEARLREKYREIPSYQGGESQLRALPLRNGGFTCSSGMVYALLVTLGGRPVPNGSQHFDVAAGYSCDQTIQATVDRAMAMCKEAPGCMKSPTGNNPSHLYVLLTDREEELVAGGPKFIHCILGSDDKKGAQSWNWGDMEKDGPYCKTLSK